jgi:sugar lactone lactonase YvrE
MKTKTMRSMTFNASTLQSHPVRVRRQAKTQIAKLSRRMLIIAVALFGCLKASAQVTTSGTLVPGNIFVSVNGHLPIGNDNFNGTVLQFTPQGAQSTLIPSILHPRGLAFDSAGNLFVTSLRNATNTSAIYKVTPDGTLTTFATSTVGKIGTLVTSIVKITPTGVQSVVASFPDTYSGLALDGTGSLFALNLTDGIVYKISPDGTKTPFVNTIDPNNSNSGGDALVFDSQGNLFVSRAGNAPNDTILKFTPAGSESIFASGLNNPRGLTFDSQGNLFVTEINGGDVLKFTPSGSASVFVNGLVGPIYIAVMPEADTPTNMNQCKNGGWQTLVRANGTQFKNQGDCIQYVNTGK